ncbi:capsular biosynthesis protein [Fulvivirga sp. M361]|uniref:tyrosine-protein phosphatase n=1 Tax=Fulvivirga sp. M361 TaxID=2594266 RepID=UPI00117AE8A1|nr:CpsB/CapC family capsule biosynthesis tyrosine phosphatase [Fulvivirga sp. M361]TRX48194.1 capsular biosynthesis protein [Fulvivirga sp. M361]
MFGLFKKGKHQRTYITDIHSHLLPGLDDGVKSMEESLEILTYFIELGTSRLYTTPHIMNDLYPNKEAHILSVANNLRKEITSKGLAIEVNVAAEYYLDEILLDRMDNDDNQLLTFGDNYLLFETSFFNLPFYLNEFIFKAKSQGYQPVLAHPERYAYIQDSYTLVEDIVQRGVLLQINTISLAGFYSKPVKKLAERLVNDGMVHFLGSDCHNINQFNALNEALKSKCYQKALDLPLKNYSL